MKIVDPTLHSTVESATNRIQHVLCTFHAKRFEDLPVAKKIGDVVRIHRAVVKEFKGIKQINVNLHYNASWCLFHSADFVLKEKKIKGEDLPVAHDLVSSEEEDNDQMEDEGDDDKRRSAVQAERLEQRRYTPYKFSGKSYSFDMGLEKTLIDSLRDWQTHFFMKSSFIFKQMSTPLNELRDL